MALQYASHYALHGANLPRQERQERCLVPLIKLPQGLHQYWAYSWHSLCFTCLGEQVLSCEACGGCADLAPQPRPWLSLSPRDMASAITEPLILVNRLQSGTQGGVLKSC